jgi:cyclophilin family peptidyl-prolyl cis-trans isomerase/HEAT repeat protein
MIKRIFLIFICSLVAYSSFSAQVPMNVGVQILKAEDARRYDSVLEDLLRSPNAEIRKRAALAAGRIGKEEAIPSLVALMEGDGSGDVRSMAAFALGEIESIKAADAILRAIGETARAKMPGQDEGGIDRSRLVEAAGKIAAANAKDPKSKDLARAIVFTLESELANRGQPNKLTIRLGLTAALRARPEGSEETVRKFVAFTDPDIVADALNTLARLRAKNANRDARDLLATHMHAIVRANAARVLGAAEDKDAVDVLIKAATSDLDPRVRVSAIRSLAAMRDPKAADSLLTRGEMLMDTMIRRQKPDLIPAEKNEFIEIAVALGRLLPNSQNARAIELFRQFGYLDVGRTAEVYIARIRVAPGRGDNAAPSLSNWRQYSTLAQVVGEFSAIEPTNDEGKRMKSEAAGVLRPMAKSFAELLPGQESAEMIIAGPDVLQAYARFKTDDLDEILRIAIKNRDVQMRATAANLLGERPPSAENIEALKRAVYDAGLDDKRENDALLAAIDALYKVSKKDSIAPMLFELNGPDHLVRKNILSKLADTDIQNANPVVKERIKYALERKLDEVLPYDPKTRTKLGQVLNRDADYRRALSRKNGSIRAIVTTAKGSFTIDLLPEDAPLTVDNFVKLAKAKYFNGLEVHRVVPNFVMQDGDPRGDGNGGPGWSIRCEINMVPYERGAVGMALSGKDTGGSQWFVTNSPQPHLDGGYTVFGRVNETGMKVVDKIVRGDKILSIRIIETKRR